MKNLSILIALFLTLSGCASISTDAVNSLVDGSTTTTGQISDSSVAKEALIHRTIRNYQNQYASSYANSGLRIKFKTKKVGDVYVQMIDEISYREKPDMFAPPTEPSKHPVWEFATVFGSNLLKYGLIGYAIHEVSGVLEAGYSAAQGTTYSGPVVNAGGDMSGEYIFGTKSIDNSIRTTTY